jgi:hypothetical protein
MIGLFLMLCALSGLCARVFAGTQNDYPSLRQAIDDSGGPLLDPLQPEVQDHTNLEFG